jgi:hypothetical protein
LLHGSVVVETLEPSFFLASGCHFYHSFTKFWIFGVLADAQVEKEEWRSENKLWWLKKSIIPFALQSIAMTMMSVLTVSSRTWKLVFGEKQTQLESSISCRS